MANKTSSDDSIQDALGLHRLLAGSGLETLSTVNDLGTSLQHLHAELSQLNEAQDAFEAARESVEEQLWFLGLDALRQRKTIPLALLRSLYWSESSLRTETIGRAWGVPANEVYKYAGEGRMSVACPECGTPVELKLRNRSSMPQLNGRRNPSARLCSDCRPIVETRIAADRERRRKEWEEMEAEYEFLRRQAIESGSVRRYIVEEYPGVPGSRFIEEEGEGATAP